MRYGTVVLLALLATSAFAQSDDFTFFPYTTGPAGGEITITARGSVQFFAPLVFFGDVKSPQVRLVDATHIKAIAPAHAIGAVPLTVLDFGVVGPLRTRLNFAYTHDLELILIPIALQPTSASQGTRWVSEIVVYNDSDDSVPIDPEVCFIMGLPEACSRPARRVPPHSSLRVEPESDDATDTQLILAPPVDQAGRLSYSVRLYETSRDPDGAGTEIPVIRWGDVQATKIWLPFVTTSARFRSTIRIFTEGSYAGTDVVLRVRDAVTGDVLSQRENSLTFPTDFPPFVIPIVTWNDLLSSPEVRAHDRVRIEVQSTGRVWALLTLTDNDTQRVEIFTPQSPSSSTSSSAGASLPRPPE